LGSARLKRKVCTPISAGLRNIWTTLSTILCFAKATDTHAEETRPIIDILVNGKKQETLVDSGAAVTLMDWRTFLELRRDISTNEVAMLRPSPLNLSTASGQPMLVKGLTTLRYSLNGRDFWRPTYIVSNLKVRSIIGADTLKAEGIILDVARKKVILPNAKQANNFLNVISKTDTTIPANGEILVSCCINISANNPLPAGREVIIRQHLPEDLATQITCEDALYRLHKPGSIEVVTSNPLGKSIFIPRGTTLALASSASWSKQIPLEIAAISTSEIFTPRKQLTIADVDLAAIPLEWRQKYLNILTKYSDIFSKNPHDIGKCTVVKQTIKLKDENVVSAQPPYRIPPHLEHVAKTHVEELLAARVIRPSNSPFSAPLLIVAKPSATTRPADPASWRTCLDYRAINANTVRDSYPLWNISDLLHRVSTSKLWSVIDCKHGFFNQLLSDDSCKFTAFSLPGIGHFEFTRSAMGLTNSPACFQRLLDYIIRGLQNTFVYLDDIILAVNTHAEMITALENVFTRFRKYHMKCELRKLQIGVADVTYLGFNLSHTRGIRAGQLKTDAISRWKPPATITQVKSFMGLCSFFRKTIKDFAGISRPLVQLTRKDNPWKAGELPPAALTAFTNLQKQLVSRPAIQPVHLDREVILTTDASNLALGAMISQINDEGVERPCMYASRALTVAEQKYTAYRLEQLAIIWSVRHFAVYLRGKEFVIRSDHAPLSGTVRKQGHQLERIKEALDDFLPFRIEYMKGEVMPSDSLSRMLPAGVFPPAEKLPLDSVAVQVVSQRERKHAKFTPLPAQLFSPPPIKKPAVVNKTLAVAALQQKKMHDGIIKEYEVANKLVSPPVYAINTTTASFVQISWDQIYNLQTRDVEIKALACALKYNSHPKDWALKEFVTKFLKESELIRGVVCITKFKKKKLPHPLVFAPANIRILLLGQAHDAPLAGHLGVKKTLDRLTAHWFWPNMEREITHYVAACVKCGQNNAAGKKPVALQRLPQTVRPLQRVHVDLAGPWTASPRTGAKYVLVIVDAHTRYLELVAIPDKEAETVAAALLTGFICTWGTPECITSDLGSEFTANVMKNLCLKLQIEQTFSSRAHPMSNGLAERAVRRTLEYIRKYIDSATGNWEELLPTIKFAYNTAISDTLNISPYLAMMGRRPNVPTSILIPTRNYSMSPFDQQFARFTRLNADIIANQSDAFARAKLQFDRKSISKQFRPGDRVYAARPHKGTVMQKMQARYFGPFIVLEVKDFNNYILQDENSNKTIQLHANNIKLAKFESQFYTMPHNDRPFSLPTAPRPSQLESRLRRSLYIGQAPTIPAALDEPRLPSPLPDNNHIPIPPPQQQQPAPAPAAPPPPNFPQQPPHPMPFQQAQQPVQEGDLLQDISPERSRSSSPDFGGYATPPERPPARARAPSSSSDEQPDYAFHTPEQQAALGRPSRQLARTPRTPKGATRKSARARGEEADDLPWVMSPKRRRRRNQE
jgi:transposase InsO family protein